MTKEEKFFKDLEIEIGQVGLIRKSDAKEIAKIFRDKFIEYEKITHECDCGQVPGLCKCW